MAWIEVHQSLLTHRKTLRLCRLLKMDKFAVTGRLMALWCWALDNAQDGVIHIEDLEVVADVMGWEEDYHELSDALLLVGFLNRGEGGLEIHDWQDYAGRLISQREAGRIANANRQRLYRERHPRVSGEVDVTESNTLRNGRVTPNNGPTVPNPTQPNSTQQNHSASSASVSNGYQKSSSSSKPAGAGKPRAVARTTTDSSKDLDYAEKARWVADVPDDLQQSWTVNDRRDALEKMLAHCKEMHWVPHETKYHQWLRDERNHVPENATEVEKLERILATYNKETGKCSNGQTYTNNMDKLRTARREEQAARQREDYRKAWGETELVQLEPGDTNSTH